MSANHVTLNRNYDHFQNDELAVSRFKAYSIAPAVETRTDGQRRGIDVCFFGVLRKEGEMKKLFLACLFLLGFCFLPFAHASAATQSDDTMILDWRSEKVWLDKGNLCVRGTFTNKRSDLTITKLNDIELTITFDKSDGSRETFIGKPAKLPMLKIPAGGSKTVTLNLGSYEGKWTNWNTEEYYVFTYINGVRW